MAAESESVIIPRKEKETEDKLKKDQFHIYARPGKVYLPLLQQRLFCDPSPVFSMRENA